MAFYFVLHWLHWDISFNTAVFIYAISMLAGAISFLPGGLGGAEPFEPSERVRGRSDDLNRRIGGLLLYGQPGVHAPRLPGGQVFAQFAFRGRDDYFAFGGQPMGERGERQHGILSIRDETRLPRAGQQTVDAGTAARLPGLGRDRLAIGVER